MLNGVRKAASKRWASTSKQDSPGPLAFSERCVHNTWASMSNSKPTGEDVCQIHFLAFFTSCCTIRVEIYASLTCCVSTKFVACTVSSRAGITSPSTTVVLVGPPNLDPNALPSVGGALFQDRYGGREHGGGELQGWDYRYRDDGGCCRGGENNAQWACVWKNNAYCMLTDLR